jgi:hypothetical protein
VIRLIHNRIGDLINLTSSQPDNTMFNIARKSTKEIARWPSFHAPTVWIIVLVILLMGGRWLWVAKSRPVHMGEIAAAFGSVGYFLEPPKPNHSGDRFLFVQSTTNGVGLYLGDATTGVNQLVYEQRGKANTSVDDISIWSWSPDDQYFIYSRTNLVICRGDTGKSLTQLEVADRKITGLAWLTPDSFACAASTNQMFLVKKQTNGGWVPTQLAKFAMEPATFAALSGSCIAWSKANSIWTLDTASNLVTLLYQAPKGTSLRDFVCSMETGTIFFRLKKNQTDSLWRITAGNVPEKLISFPTGVGSGICAAGTAGAFAYLRQTSYKDSGAHLYVQSDPSALPVELFAHGRVNDLVSSADGSCLFVTGVASNEISDSLWRYEIRSKNLTCLVPYADPQATGVSHIEATPYSLKTSSHLIKYYIYPPSDLGQHPHKKYPLVIGDTVYRQSNLDYQGRKRVPLWAEAVASCGAYVVIVERPGWYVQLDEWGDRVMSVYQHLAKDAEIQMDPRQVFLFGASAETVQLSKFVEEQPNLWKGLILLDPTELPDLGKFALNQSVPKILISDGEEEHEQQRFKTYQESALRAGTLVNVVIHPDSTHYLITKVAMQQRIQAILNCIFSN